MKWMAAIFVLSVAYVLAIMGWSYFSPMTYHDWGGILAVAVLAIQFIFLGFFVFKVKC